MRILVSIAMILGACFVVLIGLLSLLHDLLIRTTHLAPSELDRRESCSEGSAISPKVSEQVR
jgi:hypothetical protein